MNIASDKVCRKLKVRDKAKKAVDDNAEHSFTFKVSDDEMYLAVDNETFLVDCGATTHIVNEDENFIYVDPSFKPEEHFIELADVYVSQPLGYEITDKEGKTLVWKLKKSLYGLKQSGRNWHNVLHDHLKELNFNLSNPMLTLAFLSKVMTVGLPY